ncbi:regulatory protein RecX [Bdellovibrio bacteriovorus]|uniref:regulatory protein RecX n=1 Tax=Bdellovibrio bacteriovorus TaxID=959 RepID=UPI0035A5CCBA
MASMPEEKDPQKTRQAAKRKVMDLLARRDHSEKELRKKLREKFSDDELAGDVVDEAIEFAKDNNWLGDPADLAHRMAEMLHRRNKGIHYINNYLREKGLPAVESDRDLELEKALSIVKNKYDEDHKFSREDKAKVGRLLASRGFDSETVRKVIYEKL